MSMSEVPETSRFQNAPTRLYLTGYMGAGKSTIGRLLARRLGYRFQDTDYVIMHRLGKSMTRIWEEEGETNFRDAELALLKELSDQNRMVISTGGGTLSREETWKVAEESGTIIYLRAPVEALFERVIFSPKDRPMINVPDAENVFKARFYEREPFFTRAHVIVDTEGNRHRVVDKILENLNMGGFPGIEAIINRANTPKPSFTTSAEVQREKKQQELTTSQPEQSSESTETSGEAN